MMVRMPFDVRTRSDGEGLRLRLTAEQLADLWSDQATPMAWFSSGALRLDGRLEHLLDWWVLLRGAIDERPPHVAGAVDLEGVDLTRSFTLDDPDEDIAACLARIGAIPRSGHQWGTRTGNRIEALFKPIGIVEGISDVPWHKDCSFGRHSYECCSLTVGISVTGADDVSGQLRVRAGSHRALMWSALDQPGCDLPVVDLPTSTGDVTVHLSCTLHMAQPPVERERRVMYSGFTLPPFDPAAAKEGRGRLRAVREAAPTTVSQLPGHTG